MMLTDRLLDRFQEAVRGRYAIECELGRGAMGVVFLARDLRLDRPVAIKVLAPHLNRPEDRTLFLREARLAARLTHPHVVPIHAVEETAEFVYFAMAYVNGETLGERLVRAGPIGAEDAGRLLREIAWALAYSHAQGIVHRDIKPDNVLLEQGTGRALVTDFGIARPEEDPLGGSRLGTPGFASPEQASGDHADARSDIYALGALGFCLLAGRPPFAGNAREIVARQLSAPAPRVRDAAPGTPRDLAVLVDKCLAREPSIRFQSAEELAASIGRALPQVREVPPALRTWMMEAPSLLQVATALTGIPAMMAVAGLLLMLSSSPSRHISLDDSRALLAAASEFFALAAGTWALLLTSRLYRLRVLLSGGITLPQLRSALRLRLAQYEEENAAAPTPAPIARALYVASVTHVVLLVLAMIAMFNAGEIGFALESAAKWYKGYLLYFGAVAVPIMILNAFFPGRRANVRPVFFRERVKFWAGRAGDWMLKVAAWRLPRPAAAPLTTNLPTELALEDATLAIYEALPPAQRNALGDVKPTIERLARIAERSRRADAGSPDEGGRFGEAIDALETLRLGLLRLRADSTTLSGVTTYLRRAQEVTDQLGRLADAQGEVQRALRRAT